MHTPRSSTSGRPAFVLRFHSLFDRGRGYAFSCDAQGHVDLDSMPERLRANYFYVRTLVGRDFAMPDVQPTAQAAPSALDRQAAQ